eukprot:RCo010802
MDAELANVQLPLEVPKPVFKVPTKFVKHTGAVLSVWFDDQQDSTEVTLMMKVAERRLKATLRHPVFGHVEDLVTFTMLKDSVGRYKAVHFGSTYSGTQGWEEPCPQPFDAVVPYSEFSIELGSGRPVVWLNTWNNLLAERSTNLAMPVTTIASYRVFLGSRDDAKRVLGQEYLATLAGLQAELYKASSAKRDKSRKSRRFWEKARP